jgi:hypothetical protein
MVNSQLQLAFHIVDCLDSLTRGDSAPKMADMDQRENGWLNGRVLYSVYRVFYCLTPNNFYGKELLRRYCACVVLILGPVSGIVYVNKPLESCFKTSTRWQWENKPVGYNCVSTWKNIGDPFRVYAVTCWPECVIIFMTDISSLFGIISEASSCVI